MNALLEAAKDYMAKWKRAHETHGHEGPPRGSIQECAQARGVLFAAIEAATQSEKALTTWAEVEKAKADAYEDAARLVEKLAEDYTHEHGSYDGSTNAWELGHRHMEKIEGWDDAVEAIRKRKAEKCQVTQVKEVSNG